MRAALRITIALLALALLFTDWHHRELAVAFALLVVITLLLDVRRDRILAAGLLVAALALAVAPARAEDCCQRDPGGSGGGLPSDHNIGGYDRSYADWSKAGDRALEIAREIALGGAALGNRGAAMAAAAIEFMRDALGIGGGNGGGGGGGSSGGNADRR